MDAFGGAAEGGLGFPLEQWFFGMPFCTRWWVTGIVGTSFLVQAGIVSPFHLFYSARAVFKKSQVSSAPQPTKSRPDGEAQYWRLVTPFLYFGPLSFDLLFHLFFMQRHSRLLEEGSGRSPARFSWLLLVAASMLLALGAALHLQFLGNSLSSTLMYVWGRRNPDAVLNFLGFFTFRAPFLPWVLMAFNVLLNGHVPKDEICGVIVGHSRLKDCRHVPLLTLVVCYYFSDIHPPTHANQRPLDPPNFWIRFWEDGNREATAEEDVAQAFAAAPVGN
jgi:Derlin-2/3